MKKFAEQLRKRSERVNLTLDEKTQLRERLLSFMEYHPLPGKQSVDLRELSQAGIKSVPVWNGWLIGRLAGGLAVLVMIMVPALAEDTLPGDALYPIKIRFNEEVRGALNQSPYARIEWETERMERRLAEAQVLAEAGRLTPEAEAEVALAIKEHSSAAKSNIETIRESDSAEAAMAEIALSSALEVSAEVLNKKQGDEINTTSLLSGAVNDARASLSFSDQNLSYDRLFSRLETETTRAHEYLNTINVSSTERKDIDRRLADIKVKTEAAAIMKETDEVSAAKELAEALGNTRKLISFMTNLEVRRSVTVDELVPLTPTDDEQKLTLETKLAASSATVLLIEETMSQMATSSNDYLAIRDTIDQYRELEEEAVEELESENWDDAESTISLLLELSTALRDTMTGLDFELDQSTEEN